MLQTNLEFTSVIRDPIWGEIPITRAEEKIIKTQAFSRLRNVKQMSMAYLGFIGAQHTRYEHSIGTMHVAYQLYRGLSVLPPTIELEELLKDKFVTIDDQGAKYVRYAALLHDIGHAPLSHLLESAVENNPQIIKDSLEKVQANVSIKGLFDDLEIETLENYSHESFSIMCVLSDKEIVNILKAEDINPEYVAYLISGYPKVAGQIPPKLKILKPIISGDLDADRLDYINRDTYFCGMRQTIDLNLFAKALAIGLDDNQEPTILIDEESILNASSFLFSRLMLEQSVHYDAKSKYIEQVFIDLVRDFLLSLTDEERLRFLINLHTVSYDADFITVLRSFCEATAENVSAIGVTNAVKPRFRCSARALFDGSISEKINTAMAITCEEMHPRWRYYASYLLKNKNLVSALQKAIFDDLLKDIDFCLDVYSSKSSQMILPVHKAGRVKNLCDDFVVTIPHSLMITAMQSTMIKLYVERGCNLEYKVAISQAMIEKIKKDCIDDAYAFAYSEITSDSPFSIKLYGAICLFIQQICTDSLSSSNSLPNELILLTVLAALKEYARQELEHEAAVWIKKDTVLHEYISKHFSKFFSASVANSLDNGFNYEIYRMSEQLVCWGFIDHVHKPIAFPIESGASPSKFVTRTDRTINQWGEDFIRYLKEKAEITMIDEVFSVVYETQNRVKLYLQELRKMQLSPGESNISPIEKNIRTNGGCVVKFV